jgi:hypothetical protein
MIPLRRYCLSMSKPDSNYKARPRCRVCRVPRRHSGLFSQCHSRQRPISTAIPFMGWYLLRDSLFLSTDNSRRRDINIIICSRPGANASTFARPVTKLSHNHAVYSITSIRTPARSRTNAGTQAVIRLMHNQAVYIITATRTPARSRISVGSQAVIRLSYDQAIYSVIAIRTPARSSLRYHSDSHTGKKLCKCGHLARLANK